MQVRKQICWRRRPVSLSLRVLLLDAGCLCLRGEVVHQKVWVAATKATFLKTQLVIVTCLPGPSPLFFCSPTSEDRALECVITGDVVPLCIVVHHCVYSVFLDVNQWCLGIITRKCVIITFWLKWLALNFNISIKRVTLECRMQCAEAASLRTEAMPLIITSWMADDMHSRSSTVWQQNQ